MLKELKSKMESCDKCTSLSKNRNRVVFGRGNSHSPKLMLVASHPTEKEDLGDPPFNDKDGEQLDKILEYLEVDRGDCYITNAILCKTPNDRNPLKKELLSCQWRLLLEIKIVDPKIIIFFGKYPPFSVSGEIFNFKIENKKYDAMITNHPNELFKKPSLKKRVLPHWKRIKEYINHDRRKR